jgi:predicted ATP-grasp superfamily ATP-dependent carboligase
VADAARRVLDVAGYVGSANVQFLERDGELLVHDVNLRPPAPVALAMRAGLDLPAAGLAAALGLPLGPERPVGGGFGYLSLVDELRAARQARRAPPGSPSARQVVREVVAAAVSPRVLVDPPITDPLWIPPVLSAAARSRARRLAGRR